MSLTERHRPGTGPRLRRATTTAAAAALTLFAATACGSSGSSPKAAPSAPAPAPATASAASASPSGLLGSLPSLSDLKKWNAHDWDTWAKQQHVLTQAVKGFWDLQKMLQAKPADPVAPPQQPTDGGNDPLPSAIQAQAIAHPYSQNPVDGKVFFDIGPDKHAVCSATVISDPQHPGKSNLIWTAGHCLTSGKTGQQYSNIAFVPAFNSSGEVSHGRQPTDKSQFAPFGVWDVSAAITSPQWTAEGGETGSAASQYDFAVMKVANPDGNGKSLEETVGGSVPVWFNAPRDQLKITAVGYPSAAPFDGMEMERCNGGQPSRLSFDASRPAMEVIGCTMTAGSSGGGWFAVKDGKPALVSNTSIGPEESGWLAGPYLDDVAKSALDYISKKN
ncbi:trypsin-like serine peptidase [Kitasatospora sp. NBC_01302]|uniref:trypsin-like serine peptidase n=1 Tax=Kitasatospora sp. NBC_01302 TaxID=2903575 RepID=UPI002E0FD7C4|nr:trypsin-like peptidase domain-containing protein [Kitasatospora sp. NBC_01302]